MTSLSCAKQGKQHTRALENLIFKFSRRCCSVNFSAETKFIDAEWVDQFRFTYSMKIISTDLFLIIMMW